MTTAVCANDVTKLDVKEKQTVHLYYRAADTPSPIKAVLFGFQVKCFPLSYFSTSEVGRIKFSLCLLTLFQRTIFL
jgi:hypothetical protein